MDKQQRNQLIYEVHLLHPDWTYRAIVENLGLSLSRQRVQQIVLKGSKSGIIEVMEPTNNHHFTEPVSATQAARETGIPWQTVTSWVNRGLVKVVNHPGHTAPGKPILLDPVTLNERIDRYRPRKNRAMA